MPSTRTASKTSTQIARALRLQSTGRRRDAISLLKELSQQASDDAMLWFRLGTMLDASGKMDEAIPCYLRALRLDPQHRYQYEMCLYLCSSYRKTGHLSTARRWLNRAATFSRNAPLEQRLQRLLKRGKG